MYLPDLFEKQVQAWFSFEYASRYWSPLGVNVKIFDEHPRLFNIGDPPPPRSIKIYLVADDFYILISCLHDRVDCS